MTISADKDRSILLKLILPLVVILRSTCAQLGHVLHVWLVPDLGQKGHCPYQGKMGAVSLAWSWCADVLKQMVLP